MATLRAAGCVFAEDEARLLTEAARTPEELARLVAARVSGLPLEPLLGWADFCGLRILLEPGVFVPRRRTAYLAELAARRLAPGTALLDLCCGSGAIAAVLAERVADLQPYAVDVDPVAVRCARRNLLGAEVFVGDLWAALPDRLHGRIDVIVANAPYVPSQSLGLLPPEARLHEPRVALDGGEDGLAVHRRIAAEVAEWLAPGGQLLIETSELQAPVAAQFFATAGLTARVRHSRRHAATVVTGTLRSRRG